MSILLENPLPIAIVGGLAATFALVVFLSRRSLPWLLALVGVLATTAALLVVERAVVTAREQVEAALDDVMAAIEANDVDRVLACVDPAAANVRSDVQTLMPIIRVSKAHVMGAPEVRLAVAGADAEFRAFLDGVHDRTGMRMAYINQRVVLRWVRRGDRWLIRDYTAYFDGQPIDAVGSAAANRPQPR